MKVIAKYHERIQTVLPQLICVFISQVVSRLPRNDTVSQTKVSCTMRGVQPPLGGLTFGQLWIESASVQKVCWIVQRWNLILIFIRLAVVRPKGFWSDRQNQREFLDQLADQLTLKTVAPLISRLDCIFIKIRSVACWLEEYFSKRSREKGRGRAFSTPQILGICPISDLSRL